MPPLTPTSLVYAALLAAVIAGLAGALHLLSYSGALAAFVVGFFVFGFGGLPFAVPLLAFFFSSSLLSRLGRKRKAALQSEKGATRDAWQVLANGGAPAVLALLVQFMPQRRLDLLLYLGALAAVNADTWATEIGSLASARPVLITTLRRVPPGVSGAASLVGMVAALAGAAFIAGCGWLAWPQGSPALLWRIDAPEMLAVTWAGFVATFADSVLGASIQAQYRCQRCGHETDARIHCGAPARPLRGLRWVTNDTVNLAASLIGILACYLLLRFFAYPL